MPRVIEAVYEDGVIKSLETLDLEEHQRVRLLKEVAESDEFLPS